MILLGTHRSLLHLPAKAPANLLDAVRGDTVNDGLGVGNDKCHVLAVLDGTNETTGAELVNLRVRSTVQVQGDAEALGSGSLAPAQHRRVVAADLGAAGSVWRGAVELVQDQGVDRMGAVVDTSRQDVDAEHVLLRRVQAQLGAGAVDLGPDVHGGARLVRGHVLSIEGDGGLDSIDEEVVGDGRAGDELSRVLHAGGVAVRTEDLDVARGGAEGLEALIGCLAVVEGRGHSVDPDEGVRHELEGRPFPGLL